MKVKYISSACLEIDCNGFKILTDPWFTEGIYDGSWFHYEKIDPFEFISKPDLIYISHIHPDHYDPIFLKKLFDKFGEVPIFIPDLNPNYLYHKGRRDGLKLEPRRYFENPQVQIWIEENTTGSISDIDSAILIKDKLTKHSVLNINDCIPNDKHINKIKTIIRDNCDKLDILALGYTGAGCYPHTYFDIEKQEEFLIIEGLKRKEYFFERYRHYSDHFNASFNLPFAGEYLLGGKLSYLNKFRGVADAFEVSNFDENAIILKNGGSIDLALEEITNQRFKVHDSNEIFSRLSEIKNEKMDYEKDLNLTFETINFPRLLKSAAFNAQRKSEVDQNYCFVFSITNDLNKVQKRYFFEIDEMVIHEIGLYEKINYKEYSEIIIDFRYLFGLLTTLYHWNNAEIGSQFLCRRVPISNFSRKVQYYLNFFSIA